MLKIQHLSQSFGDKIILDNVSFTAKKGEIIGLVAPNGTGKSTLLNIVMNYLSPDSGRVRVDDQFDYSSKKNEIDMHKKVSFLPEMNDLYGDLSGLDHLKLYGRLWQNWTDHIPKIVNRLLMGHYVKKPVRTYSLGMKQRLCFAMLLAADTEIMLMDEVMNGLDPDNVALLTEILLELKENGKVILIASHLLENLDLFADRVMFLKDGKIVLEKKEPVGDMQENLYLKVKMNSKQYEYLLTEERIPTDHQWIAQSLVCVPLKGRTEEETGDWMSRFMKEGFYDISVGEIGTSEWYKEFYQAGKE